MEIKMKYTIERIKAWIDQLNLCATEGDIYRFLHFRETPFYLELDNGIRWENC